MKSNQKILFLNHNFEGFGTYFRCFFLGKHLARIGYNVALVCASKNNFELGIRKKEIEENFEIITLPRIRFHDYTTGHSARAFINSFITLFRDYDILHSFAVAQPATAIPTLVTKIFRNKPIIVDWDDDWSEGFAGYHNVFTQKVLKALELNVPRVAERITVVSDFLQQKAIKCNFDPNKITKLPNGADTESIRVMDKRVARTSLQIRENLPLVVAMGHTYTNFSLEMLFRSFSMVVTKKPSTRLLMIGRTKIPGHLQNRYRNLFSNIVLTDEQPGERVSYYLAAADVLVLPMEDCVIEKARWPIRLGDYLSSGRLIVSNAVGEVKRVLENDRCGLTCSVSDSREFADVITLALNSEKLQQELGKRARKVAEEKYCWGNLAQNLANIYEEVIDESPSG